MKKFTDLPSPETIRKFTVSVAAPVGTFNKTTWKNMEAGLTARGTPRKLEYRRRGKTD